MLDILVKNLPNNIDGVLIVSPINRLFFTGYETSDGVLLATKNGSVFLTDSRYIEEAHRIVKCCESAELVRISEQVPFWCEKFGCKTLGIEADRVTVSELKQYRKALKNIKLTSVGTDRLIDAIRVCKTHEQVEKIIKAQRIAEKSFDHILKFIKEGVTEKEIALELDFFMLKNGADGLSFETIAVSGKNSSKPHGVPTDKKVEKGDFITMDYGAIFDGYHSDMTRTVGVGELSDEQIKVYNTVLQAQLATLSVLKSGLSCFNGDKAARDVITQAGYGDYFRHSTGHGVGVEIHEKPYLSSRSKEILHIGNIVTVEPGIYIPDNFGVRIEDMALITEDGCHNLTNIAKDLIVL